MLANHDKDVSEIIEPPLPGFEELVEAPPLETMTTQEFQEGGYLQELNRRFLHPLGLALAVDVQSGTDDRGYMNCQIWDYRNDPEGFFFVEDTINAGVDKIYKIDAEVAAKRKTRISICGSIIQQPNVQLALEGEVVG